MNNNLVNFFPLECSAAWQLRDKRHFSNLTNFRIFTNSLHSPSSNSSFFKHKYIVHAASSPRYCQYLFNWDFLSAACNSVTLPYGHVVTVRHLGYFTLANQNLSQSVSQLNNISHVKKSSSRR